jgi:HrpA-like RNA helicase
MCIVVVTARQRLIEEVRSSRAVIIVGETGSGKTTRMLAPTQLFLRSLWWLMT